MTRAHLVVAVAVLFAGAACGPSDRDFTDPSGNDAATQDVAVDTRRADVGSDAAPDDASADSTAIDAAIDAAIVDGRADNRPPDGPSDASSPDVAIDNRSSDSSGDTPSTDAAPDAAPDAAVRDADADNIDGAADAGSDGPDADTATDTADVDAGSYALTVTLAGNGLGLVTSSPAGINCGSTCSANFDYGQMVTLTAASSADSTFTGWSGGGCSGTGPCTLSVAAATNVTATFALLQYTLTVSKSGSGAGTVTSSPSGIDCGGTCSSTFTHGMTVVLTANPAAPIFGGWSGACSGTGSCSVSMTAVRSVTATFYAALSCTTVTNAASCTNGAIPEINLGAIGATACHDQCQVSLAQAGVTAGCWVVATNTNCYCRSGVLNLGGTAPGGTCN